MHFILPLLFSLQTEAIAQQPVDEQKETLSPTAKPTKTKNAKAKSAKAKAARAKAKQKLKSKGAKSSKSGMPKPMAAAMKKMATYEGKMNQLNKRLEAVEGTGGGRGSNILVYIALLISIVCGMGFLSLKGQIAELKEGGGENEKLKAEIDRLRSQISEPDEAEKE
jgi:hypothetical protein